MNAQSVLMDKSGFMTHSSQPINKPANNVKELSRLTVEELADRWDSIDTQSQVYSWFLCYYIRQKLKSKTQFGRFIENMRVSNPYHPLCVISQQQRTRYIQAAAFLLKHRVTDVSKIGIQPTAFYMIIRPINEPVAEKVFKAAMTKNQPVYVVKKIIDEERAKLGLSVEPEPMQMKAEVRELRQVENKVVEDKIIERVIQTSQEVEEIDGIEAELRAVDERLAALKHDVLLDNETRRRRDLFRELSAMDMGHLTQDQRVTEMMLLDQSYRIAELKLIADHQVIINRYKPSYRK